MLTASAPGKLMLSGEYAVLSGAPSLLIAVNRRAVAYVQTGAPRGSSAFLLAVAAELVERYGESSAAAKLALEIAVDSRGFYDGTSKLGLGSSAAVTVAATALALAEGTSRVDEKLVHEVAAAAHGRAQAPSGARGSGADIAAATFGGTLVFTNGRAEKRTWPRNVRITPFFTGTSASTTALVRQVMTAREKNPAVDVALATIAAASHAACASLTAPADLAAQALIGAFALGAAGVEQLAEASGADLVPECVVRARTAISRLGGTAKTTGAGGGDLGIAVTPSSVDVTEIDRALIQAGCRPVPLALDETGVDLRPDAS